MNTILILLALAIVPSADDGYAAGIQKWRAAREAALRADDGWLSVAGLFWLKEGVNTAGSAASNDIVLPASAPARLGQFELKGERVRFAAAPGVAVTEHDGVVRSGPLTMFPIKRGERHAIRLRDTGNPRRRAFKGLQWYAVNPEYRVTGRFIPHAERRIEIANVLGGTFEMINPGQIELAIGGRTVRLEALHETDEKDEFFLIFRDSTSETETYHSGRYLYADLPKKGSDTVVVDFNKAHSPPCAFTDYATCPLPPRQNQLPFAVPAGEKRPKT